MLRIHPLRVEGITLERSNVADPFTVDARGGLRPRVPGADYRVVTDLAEADLAALPAHWDAYGGRLRRRAYRALDRAAAAGLRSIVWVNGDHERTLDRPDVHSFHLAADRDRPSAAAGRHTYPVLLDDLRATTRAHSTPPAGIGPLVGFCGQAAETPADRARRLAGLVRGRLRPGQHAEPWRSHVALRSDALATLAADPRVRTDFVVRDRYRAGLRDPAARRDPAEPTTVAFHDNVLRTDFTLCVRGGGNFSVRLYEVLCLGRIPVLVDTGGILPWDGIVDWDRLLVRVPADRLGELPDHLVEAHDAAGGPEGIRAWQRRCRRIWEDRLGLEGFFGHFAEHFPTPSRGNRPGLG